MSRAVDRYDPLLVERRQELVSTSLMLYHIGALVLNLVTLGAGIVAAILWAFRGDGSLLRLLGVIICIWLASGISALCSMGAHGKR